VYTRVELEALVGTVPWWWHSIDLGQGVVTPGHKGPLGVMQDELATLQLPDLTHKTVLDIGTMDGFYAFEAERRGARRVVAVDYYSWSLDLANHATYMADCQRRGVRPAPDETSPHWHPDTLPGKRGYDTAHQALGSRVETVVADYLTLDPEKFGTFDVTLFLGVLYHLEDPLRGLRQVAALTRGVAVIETAAMLLTDRDEALVAFYEANELDNDMSNWWVPTMPALLGLCRAAGFRDVKIVQGPPVVKDPWWRRRAPPVRYYRAMVQAFK
jgi:tRNA (mo5U34)-methyltransferase